jgi:hypothetical protein
MSEDELFESSGNELPKDLFNLSIAQLRELAKAHNIKVSATRKADIVFLLQEAGITNTDGVELKEEVVKEAPKKEEEPVAKTSPVTLTGKIALFSERNRFNSDFGRLSVGYNIVNAAQKEFWLNFSGVREATPKEVAKHYGVK